MLRWNRRRRLATDAKATQQLSHGAASPAAAAGVELCDATRAALVVAEYTSVRNEVDNSIEGSNGSSPGVSPPSECWQQLRSPSAVGMFSTRQACASDF